MSRAQVSIHPAEFGSWADARAELMNEAKRPLKAQLEAEISNAVDADEIKGIRSAYLQREQEIEQEIDHKPLEVHISLGMAYNFLSK